MLPRLRIGTIGGPPTGRRLERALNDAARLIRSHLDTQKVLQAAVEAAHPMLASRRTSAWLTTGKEPPRLAHAVGHDVNEEIKAPAAVMEAAARKRAVLNDLTGKLAIPILAPRAGLVGVLSLERTEWSAEARDFAERLAYETALALETAHLFERAVAEKDKSEAILARVGDAVVVTGRRGKIAEWNRAAEQIFRTGGEAAIGRRCEEVLGLRRGEQALSCESGCPLLQATDRGEAPLGEEVWRDSEGGRRQPLLATAEAVRDPDGTISDVVHSFRDITRLKEADEAKTLFLATASHELKTPLTVIQGFTQTLLDHQPSPELREQALRMIERRAMELNEIVNRLLLSSRIEAGRMQLNLAQVEIGPLVTERVEAMQAATRHPLALRVDPETPRVVADPSALAIVVDHLLDNASKYSPDGNPIEVFVRGRDRVELVVVDHGIGMDAEQKARCFEKFWQAESSDVRRFGGTGIGLYIVRSLVEAMQGTVDVRSDLGIGSTFTIGLQSDPATTDVVVGGPEDPITRRQQPPSLTGVGEQSVIREFMRQIGVPVRRER
ncbi:MAG: ATP-binding protein [Actinomycetota bacterium]